MSSIKQSIIRNIHKLLTLWKAGAVFRKTQSETMLKYLNINDADRVLDVGCGHGLIDLEMLKYKPNINLILLDISFKDLLIAKLLLSTHNVNNIDVVSADATHIPFRSSTFDRVLMSSVLQHISNYLDALREVSSVLRKGVIFVLNVPSSTPYMFLPKVFGEEVVKLLFYTFNVYHVFDPKKLFLELQKVGLRVVEYRYMPSLFSMFIFELIAFLMVLERLSGLRLSKFIVFLSLLFPFTRFIERLFRFSTGTEYIIKAIKVR